MRKSLPTVTDKEVNTEIKTNMYIGGSILRVSVSVSSQRAESHIVKQQVFG